MGILGWLLFLLVILFARLVSDQDPCVPPARRLVSATPSCQLSLSAQMPRTDLAAILSVMEVALALGMSLRWAYKAVSCYKKTPIILRCTLYPEIALNAQMPRILLAAILSALAVVSWAPFVFYYVIKIIHLHYELA